MLSYLIQNGHYTFYELSGFPGGHSGKKPTCQCRRHKRHGLLWPRVWSLGQEDPLQKEIADSGILVWRISWSEDLTHMNYLKTNICVLVTQSCPTLCNPMDCSPPGSSVMEFSRQEYWSGLPFPSPEDLPHPGIKPRSPTLQADALTCVAPRKPLDFINSH